MRISDWSSDVCSSDLTIGQRSIKEAVLGSHEIGSVGFIIICLRCESPIDPRNERTDTRLEFIGRTSLRRPFGSIHEILIARKRDTGKDFCIRSEEHTSELQSLMRISYAVFCLKKK